MNLTKIINIFYIIYMFYIFLLINSTDITFYTILPAILIMWINYFIFCAGYRFSTKGKNIDKQNSTTISDDLDGWLLNRSKKTLLLLGSLSLFFSIYAVNFYTGQTPITIVENSMNGVSLYYEYQTYFKNEQLNDFSLTKIPFILMLLYIKLALFYSYISFFIIKKYTTKFEKFFLFLISISSIYVGIGRGTNFEFFEIVMLIIFTILSRQVSKFPIKSFSTISILIFIMIMVYFNRISDRGVIFNYYMSQDVNFDPNGLLPLISPELTFIIINLFGYFGFGFFYVSQYVSQMWFSSISNLFVGFIPMGYQIVNQESISETMRNLIDTGVMWHPDVALIINNLGFIGLMIYCFLLGVINKYLNENNRKSPMLYLTSFIMLMQMVSLPIGNFVVVSSASKLIVMLLLLYWFWKLFIKVRIKLF